MVKLIVFDVDGTLIDTKIGSFKELGIYLGKEKEIREHDEEYQRRKHLGPWGLEELAEIFKNVKEDKIKQISEEIVSRQLMQGAEKLINELKKRGYLLVSYSSSPMWIMNVLKKKFNFDDICGNKVEVKDGRITGKLLEKIDRYGKASRLKNFMYNNGVKKEDTYIIGDSVTDLPMAQYGHFIAFNSNKQEVKDEAEHIVDEKNLIKLLKFIK